MEQGGANVGGSADPETSRAELEDWIAREAAMPLPEPARRWVERFARQSGVAAVVFYGSGLREAADAATVFDFYLLVRRMRDFEPSRALAAAGRLAPPNVYFREDPEMPRGGRCKCAVMPVSSFVRAARGGGATPHIWARMCQPARLPYVARPELRASLVSAFAESVVVFHRRALPRFGAGSVEDLWAAGLRSTYRDEIRSEGPERVRAIVRAAPESFAERTRLALPLCRGRGHMEAGGRVVSTVPPGERRRAKFGAAARRPLRKTLVVARLVKAAFTFRGGLDYARWKIERHSGVRLEITPFQRRHPVLGGLLLAGRAWRCGGLR